MSDIFNSQPANLVLASPDNASGEPSFRALVANDIPGLHAVALTANANVGTSFVYLAPQFKIPANSLQPSSSFRVTVAGLPPAGQTLNFSFQLKFGPNGNNADTVILNANGVAQVQGTGVDGLFQEFVATVRATGASGSIVAASSPVLNNADDSDTVPTPSIGTPITIDTTQDNYLGVSMNTSISTNTHITMAIVEQVR